MAKGSTNLAYKGPLPSQDTTRCIEMMQMTPEQWLMLHQPKSFFSCYFNWWSAQEKSVSKLDQKGPSSLKWRESPPARRFRIKAALTVSLFCKARAWSCCRARFTLEIAVKPACLFLLAARNCGSKAMLHNWHCMNLSSASRLSLFFFVMASAKS